MRLDFLESSFKRIFQRVHEHKFFAPGRINLIVEQTDYNGGNVFPLAITCGTYALVAKRNDRMIRFMSLNFEELGVLESSLDSLDFDSTAGWINYPKGVTKFFIENGHAIDHGFDVLYYGDIPNGAGLSSSASIEMVTGVLLQRLFNLTIERIEMIKLCKKVENEYIGVHSGIMDQFAIGMGKKGHAIWLNCETLEYEYAPVELEEEQIVIMNTNKRRQLASSKYNERRNECEEALKRIQQNIPVRSLGEVTPAKFEEIKSVINDELLSKRAAHVIYENDRTEKALNYLKAGDLLAVGELMNDSHRSLKNDFEVTGKELDTLVEFAWKQNGVIGARMTGAGFGGCAIAIVKTSSISSFIDNVGAHYFKECGLKATFYTACIGDGAHEMKENA